MTILETVIAANNEANRLLTHYNWLRNCRAPQAECAAALTEWSKAHDELNAVFFYLKKAMGK